MSHQARLTEEAASAFISSYWLSSRNEKVWQAALAERGWHCFDWPQAYGGPGWDRSETWLWIEAAASQGCPLPDERFSVIAPLALALCPQEHRHPVLSRLAEADTAWQLLLHGTDYRLEGKTTLVPEPSSDQALILADDGAEGQLVLVAGTRVIHLGEGRAPLHLARHQSAAINLWEAKLTASLIHPLIADAKDPLQDRHREAQLSLDTLVAMYLSGRNPLALNLLSARLRQVQADLLKDALGHYFLLAPDEQLTSNEPIPFATERRHLHSLLYLVTRSANHLKNDLFTAIEQATNDQTRC